MSQETALEVAYGQGEDESSPMRELDKFASPLLQAMVFEPESTVIAESVLDSVPASKRTDQQLARKIKKYFPGKLQQKPKSEFTALQKWEGTIIDIKNDICRAYIRDLMDENNPEEEITFSLNEVSKSDKHLAVEGAIFYWMIGYFDEINGQRTRQSRIIFRRLPGWRKKDLDRLKAESKSLLHLLPDDQSQELRDKIEST